VERRQREYVVAECRDRLRTTIDDTHVSNDADCRAMLSVTSDEQFIAYEALAEGGDYAVAVCTPLMKRVHRLVPHAGQVVVVDAGQPVDKRRHCRVVLLATSSAAGGLPLGVLAATSDASLRRAVQLYATLLDSRCFYGRGLQGPMLFLVDDYPALRTSLCAVFTASACLLSTYRLLVSYWRELWNRRSAVSTEQRSHCFVLFRAAVFADTVDQLQESFSVIERDVSCASTQSYVSSIYDRRSEWSVCCQSPDWPALSCVRPAGANRGLCGYASRALKDVVVDYIKSMKTVETVVTFVCERCDCYYERRLTDTVNGRLDDASAVRFMQDCHVDARVVCTVAPSHYTVTLQPSTAAAGGIEGVCHDVELSVGLCSCTPGCTGSPCVHQWAAILHTQARSWLIRPVSSTAAQRVLSHIATGLGYAESSWFASSHPLQWRCEDDTMMSDVDVLVSGQQSDVADDKQIIINWNGTSYEVSLHEQETLIMEPSGDVLATTSPAIAPARHRLRQSLSKIEDAYLTYPDVMETAINTFCQTVESIDILEHLNSALLFFGNSFLTSGSTALSFS